MPNAHSAYRPVPEVELLGTRRISLKEAILGLQEAVAGETGSGADSAAATPGSSLISFEQIPRVLESLNSEWKASSAEERSDNCFSEVRGRLTMHMHPCFLGDKLMQGMREAAGHLLMRHSAVLEHVLLGFKELKPANSHAAVVGESAYVHFLVEFRSIAFQPRKGTKMIGRLSGVQTAVGINCTIFNNFNFFVHKGDLPQDTWFDADAGAWMSGEKKLVKKSAGYVPLLLTVGIKEDSGPLNFKGVLAKHVPPPRTVHVMYDSPEHAELAASRLNGITMGGGSLRCKLDRESQEAGPMVIVTGVPVAVDMNEVKNSFGQIGKLTFCKIKERAIAKDAEVEEGPGSGATGAAPPKLAKRRKVDGAADGAKRVSTSGSASSASKQKPGDSV